MQTRNDCATIDMMFYGIKEVSKIDKHILGARIKELRTERGVSLKDMAAEINVSASLLSQIERNLANPSLNTLRAIANYLDVPMFSFFEVREDPDAMVVRYNDRIQITNGKNNSKELKQGYDLLSPDMKGVIQMCEMSLGPHQYSAEKFNVHRAEEVAVCTEESIELVLKNGSITLDKGDSVRIPAGTPHRWKNSSDKNCAIIFAISPPDF